MKNQSCVRAYLAGILISQKNGVVDIRTQARKISNKKFVPIIGIHSWVQSEMRRERRLYFATWKTAWQSVLSKRHKDI